jgi:hypothetical protein
VANFVDAMFHLYILSLFLFLKVDRTSVRWVGTLAILVMGSGNMSCMHRVYSIPLAR